MFITDTHAAAEAKISVAMMRSDLSSTSDCDAEPDMEMSNTSRTRGKRLVQFIHIALLSGQWHTADHDVYSA